MSYLLELLGRGLLGELSAAFTDVLRDDGDDSTAHIEECVQREPEVVDHHRRLGARLLADRRLPAARDRFLEALARDGENVPCRVGLACALDELGQTRQAVEELESALQVAADAAAIWFAVGFLREKLGETEKAAAAYDACTRLSPDLANAHERLAAIALKLDDVGAAVEHYEHLCWCDPGDLSANLMLATLYLRAKRYEDAVRRFQFAITIDPDNWEIQDDLTTAYAESGRYEDAIEIVKGRLESTEGDVDRSAQWIRLGDLHVKIGSTRDALAAYRRAVQTNPDCLEGMIKVGTACLRLGRYRRAAESFAKAIEINDRIVTAYVGLSLAQLASGARAEGMASLEMAGGIEPNSTLLFSEIARLQLKVSAAKETERYLSPQSVAACPSGPMNAEVAGVVDRQIERFRSALREHPTHADWHYRLGVLQRHRGDLGGAIKSLRRAAAINPNYAKALIKLGLALRDANDGDGAVEALSRALALDPESARLHYELGLIFADRREFTQAVGRFEQAICHDPGREDVLANLALALQSMGLADRAEATLHTLAALCNGIAPVAESSAATDPARRPCVE